MTVVDADQYQAQERLEMALDELERTLAYGHADPLILQMAFVVVLLARYLLATQR